SENILVPVGLDSDPRFRSGNPLKQHDLFRQFARLPVTREAIADFAGRHGQLGDYCMSTNRRKPPERMCFGERLQTWDWHIAAMATTIKAWEAVVRGDAANLEEVIRWEDLPPQVRKESTIDFRGDDPTWMFWTIDDDGRRCFLHLLLNASGTETS